jgi:phosphate transport system substrate-binding protein
MDAQNANVTVLAIDGIQPSITSLLHGSYPFWSVEHLYTRGNGTSQFRAFLSFLNSTQEATVFVQSGALPVSMMPSNILASHLPGPEI